MNSREIDVSEVCLCTPELLSKYLRFSRFWLVLNEEAIAMNRIRKHVVGKKISPLSYCALYCIVFFYFKVCPKYGNSKKQFECLFQKYHKEKSCIEIIKMIIPNGKYITNSCLDDIRICIIVSYIYI